MDEAEARERLRRMVAADTAPSLSEAEVDDLVSLARTTDAMGLNYGDAGWTPAYRLSRAALEGWRWKMAKASGGFDFSSDGASYSRSQVIDHCERMIKQYGKKAGVTTVIPQTSAAADSSSDVIGNL